MPSEQDIERIVGCKPRDMSLYVKALTHKSALSPGDKTSGTYDRLEFLGDAQLGFVIAHHLFAAYPDADEGFLSRMRNLMVSRPCLAEVARCLGLADHIIMNKRALNKGWNHNDRILEDVLEALVAAVLEDQGAEVAAAFILRCVREHMDLEEIRQHRNYKDSLMQYTQNGGLPAPRYHTHVQDTQGRAYVARVDVDDAGQTVSGWGTAAIKKIAQQAAAREALVHLGQEEAEAH